MEETDLESSVTFTDRKTNQEDDDTEFESVVLTNEEVAEKIKRIHELARNSGEVAPLDQSEYESPEALSNSVLSTPVPHQSEYTGKLDLMSQWAEDNDMTTRMSRTTSFGSHKEDLMVMLQWAENKKRKIVETRQQQQMRREELLSWPRANYGIENQENDQGGHSARTNPNSGTNYAKSDRYSLEELNNGRTDVQVQPVVITRPRRTESEHLPIYEYREDEENEEKPPEMEKLVESEVDAVGVDEVVTTTEPLTLQATEASSHRSATSQNDQQSTSQQQTQPPKPRTRPSYQNLIKRSSNTAINQNKRSKSPVPQPKTAPLKAPTKSGHRIETTKILNGPILQQKSFDVNEITRVVHNVFEEFGPAFHSALIKDWAQYFSAHVVTELMELQLPFKFVVHVLTVPSDGSALTMKSGSIWDTKLDGSATICLSTDSYRHYVTVFGLAIY